MSAEGRAELADLLVDSLDAAELGRIDRAWLAEAKRRRDEVRSGAALTVSAQEALIRARSTLER